MPAPARSTTFALVMSHSCMIAAFNEKARTTGSRVGPNQTTAPTAPAHDATTWRAEPAVFDLMPYSD